MNGEDPLTQTHAAIPQPTVAGDAVATPRPGPAVSPLEKIGPYSILKTLGRGGMGVVYLALDSQSREVALKVIPAGKDADPTDLARFQAEARAVSRLDHPNIVKLKDVGEAAGVAYLAMEYVTGGTLYRRITQGTPIDPGEAAHLVEQVARAIDYSHRHGVLHRDLKPSNILLTDAGVPKLADFGLAKHLDQSLRLTRTGIAVGTPHYMAPEQARGESAIGPGLDIHGLGAILYELLTGVPPFSGRNPADTMEQVVHKKPTPPSQLRKDLPPALEAICLKCLEKDPRNRHRTAGVLASELKQFLEGKAESTQQNTVAERVVPMRVLWFVVSVAVGLIALTAVLTWYLTSQAYRT
jgi:serine/threonine-protein kinase